MCLCNYRYKYVIFSMIMYYRKTYLQNVTYLLHIFVPHLHIIHKVQRTRKVQTRVAVLKLFFRIPLEYIIISRVPLMIKNRTTQILLN